MADAGTRSLLTRDGADRRPTRKGIPAVTITSAHARTNPEATAVARDLIASFGQDPDRYVPGTVTTLPGTRTTTYDLACSPRCPHDDSRCHRSHAAWLSDEPLDALMSVVPAAVPHRTARPHLPVQRRGA